MSINRSEVAQRLLAGESVEELREQFFLDRDAVVLIEILEAAAAAKDGPSETITGSPDYEYKWGSGADPSSDEEAAAFYRSPAIAKLRERLCDIGSRMWQREYTDGNGGNLTTRVGDNLVLCTPTLACKGFMEPSDIALVTLEGEQLAGRYKRTSEVFTHLEIMKRIPQAKACCHAHPPYATAHAVAKRPPPQHFIPEAEVFLGEIGLAEYETPGTTANAINVGEAAERGHMSILMINHGVITWGKDSEDAYWKMENTEAYCKTMAIAASLGKPLTPIAPDKVKELVQLRKRFGIYHPKGHGDEA